MVDLCLEEFFPNLVRSCGHRSQGNRSPIQSAVDGTGNQKAAVLVPDRLLSVSTDSEP